MYLDRIMPASGLAALDFSGVGSLDLTAGPGRFTTPGPTRQGTAARAGHLSQAETSARRRRHDDRVREQEAHDQRQRDEDLGRTRRDR